MRDDARSAGRIVLFVTSPWGVERVKESEEAKRKEEKERSERSEKERTIDRSAVEEL